MQGLMMPTPLTIPELITPRIEGIYSRRVVVSRSPGSVHRTTWGEVAMRARRLATALRGMGIGPGDRVATFGWNTHRHLEAYFAVPSMGSILHTLNIRLFEDQLAYVVEHAEDRIVLCDRSLLPLWRRVEKRLARALPVVVMPDTDDASLDGDAAGYEDLVAASEPVAEWPPLDENTAAAMCYTSGTTGSPKGVVYSHRSTVLHSIVSGMTEAIGLSSRDRACIVVPMFHANAWGLPYTAAIAGASAVLPGADLSAAGLCDLIAAERCTLAAGVPTIWMGILQHWRKHRPDLSSLRTTVCGGSAVPPALSAAWEHEIGVPILHAWGMTEMSPIGTVSHLPVELGDEPEEDVRRSYATSQGQPVPGVLLRVVDADGREVATDGVTMGEIQVRGPWIASAYYRDGAPPDKFDPSGWLRTGDVATVDEHGCMRIVDRTKDLVKSGGEWISSVELEGHLMAHPDVLEAAVIAVPDMQWGERPCACVVLRPEARGRVTEQDIIEHLRPRVARYWVPERVEFIDEVPKTSVGKFDKKVLRARYAEETLSSSSA